MKLLITKKNGEQIQVECDSFEFRTNDIGHWIRADQGNQHVLIQGIVAVKGNDF